MFEVAKTPVGCKYCTSYIIQKNCALSTVRQTI